MNIKRIKLNAKRTDIFLKKYFKKQNKSGLVEPMKYGTLAGGKKIRTSMIVGTGKLFNLNTRILLNVCAAVECIHSYSLIHDDLPCMDDDSLRRGKLSTHVKYGESTAILAGNSLLTLAFEMIADKNYKIHNSSKVELIKGLAECSGHTGVAGGQYLDLSFEKQKRNLNQIIDMQRKKTGKLFNFCCFAAGVIAKKNEKEKKFLSKLGEDIGLLFQLADDFIDIHGSQKVAGKPIKKDKKKGKSTLINLMGYKNAFKYADNLKRKLLLNLKKRGKNTIDLRETIEFILKRDY